jgi:hypothetical protein
MKMTKQRGSVTGYVLLTMMVLITASLGAASYSLGSLARADRDREALIAFAAAQAGLELSTARAVDDAKQGKGKFTYRTGSLTSDIASIAPDAVGDFEIVPQQNPARAWLTSTVTYGKVTRSIRTQLRARDVGVWNNAIFAGTGASGHAINGNVDIRGSVHILGDGEAYSDLNGNGRWDPAETFTDLNGNGIWDPGEPFVDANGDGVWTAAEPYNDTNGNGKYDPPLTQTDLNSSFSGTAYIGNNYSGMPSSLLAQIPGAPIVNGMQTLGTEVRVKHGRIGINGNARIGTDSVVDGGSSKNTIDGSFVNDGYTGNQGEANVFSDNGTKNTYDLSSQNITFPLLSGIGSKQYVDSNGVTWPDQETFLNNRSITVPVSLITSTTPAFSYGPDAWGNSISFAPQTSTTPARLTIQGIVRISGNLQLGDKDTIRYQGSGTIYTTGDMRIDGDILPRSAQTFPTTARMGFVARRNMLLATGSGSSQLSMAGAFYAQGSIVSAKQNQIAGTFVANYFDLGTNVPNIYQVPALSSNMPPGMPGAEAIVSLRTAGWRERH